MSITMHAKKSAFKVKCQFLIGSSNYLEILWSHITFDVDYEYEKKKKKKKYFGPFLRDPQGKK